MSLTDRRCDRCGRPLLRPAAPATAEAAEGVRFSYHPGDPGMRDDSGVVCGRCWTSWEAEFGPVQTRVCARCGVPVTRRSSLHLRRSDTVGNSWQLCRTHAVDLLNGLRTVDPKFDPATFRLPLENRSAGHDDQPD